MDFIHQVLTNNNRKVMRVNLLSLLLTFLLVWSIPIMLSGCSGGDVSGTTATGTTNTSGGGSTSTSSGGYTLYLSLSKTKILTDNTDSAVVTATLAKDNVAQPDQTVTFTASAGLLLTNAGTTDSSGSATATITSGPNASNEVVWISATSNGASTSIPIQLLGNSLTLSIPQSDIANQATQKLTASLKNAAGVGIAYTDLSVSTDPASGVVTLSASPYTTDENGECVIDVTGSAAGAVTITASAMGAKATQDLTVAQPVDVFEITSPTDNSIFLETNKQLVVTVNAPNQSQVIFQTTVGHWQASGTDTDTVDVDPVTKTASATFISGTGGTGTITVYDLADQNTKDSLQVTLYAPPAESNKITLQASANNVMVTPVGSTSNNSVTLTATVRNVDNIAVGGATVYFTLSNTTGGGEYLSSGVAVTDDSGKATTIFYSGSVGSSNTGVKVTATVANTTISSSTDIAIRGLGGSISFGPPNKIEIISAAMYQQTIELHVSDADGVGVAGAQITLRLWPLYYRLGGAVVDPSTGTCGGYAYNTWPDCSTTIDIENEDANSNLILDPGEDTGPYNMTDGAMEPDGQLTPANSDAGSIPATVTTDSNGNASFPLKYFKEDAMWVVDQLTASTLVQGTETQATKVFVLPPEKSEYDNCELFNSPFGYFSGSCIVKYSF